eukprot:CAMPEP_0176387918 /NCGR_PEP_ID=MMETSP0126-20121128/37147_1 /TAXON_ID=141414 ORGANISM="Strombidinopsis acuminatum, Strain SPMC142" /NCGR_SAMPLE_ID=MMETSP0126 /ASSEMBLY_ACC=CAM_ASM_000229 /LENGTH=58 /DNA_ID=CAMNT_0017755793 /DNA_START=55 /DNA_END=231 /DNA_ORIENTATION=-
MTLGKSNLGEQRNLRLTEKAKIRKFKKESMIYGIPVKNSKSINKEEIHDDQVLNVSKQ